MYRPSLAHWARRHLMVLLCFALLLPAAQVASAVHALAHLASVQQDGRSQDAADSLSCEICPVAAAVGLGGAPAAMPVSCVEIKEVALIAEVVSVAELYSKPAPGDALCDMGPWWGQPARLIRDGRIELRKNSGIARASWASDQRIPNAEIR